MKEALPPAAASPDPTSREERLRLYIDESGDHVFRHLDLLAHRYLCLLGVWFKNRDYESFYCNLERLKTEFFDPHPDDPVILHREDILHRRGIFSRLSDLEKGQLFDNRLISIIGAADFHIVAVVIDKKALLARYGQSFKDAFHPYHTGVGLLYAQYLEYLNHFNGCGDVMAESRGGKEDRLLRRVYYAVGETIQGGLPEGDRLFQTGITSKELKVKPKSANIAGLQLADILAHPCGQQILRDQGISISEPSPFAKRLLACVADKFHKHLLTGEVKGSGTHFVPVK